MLSGWIGRETIGAATWPERVAVRPETLRNHLRCSGVRKSVVSTLFRSAGVHNTNLSQSEALQCSQDSCILGKLAVIVVIGSPHRPVRNLGLSWICGNSIGLDVYIYV